MVVGQRRQQPAGPNAFTCVRSVAAAWCRRVLHAGDNTACLVSGRSPMMYADLRFHNVTAATVPRPFRFRTGMMQDHAYM